MATIKSGGTRSRTFQQRYAGERPEPASEKQSCCHGGYHDHVGVLREKIERPAEPAELRHVAGDELGLSFRQIEWGAVGLCNGSDEIAKEGHRREQHKPDTFFALRFYD